MSWAAARICLALFLGGSTLAAAAPALAPNMNGEYKIANAKPSAKAASGSSGQRI